MEKNKFFVVLHRLSKFLRNKQSQLKRKKTYAKIWAYHVKLFNINNIQEKKLSDEQKRQVDSIFGKYKKIFKCDFSYGTYEMCYTVTGEFSPYVVPLELNRYVLAPMMNSQSQAKTFRDKNFFDIFVPNCRFPKVYLRNVAGHYYNDKFELLDFEQASKTLAKFSEYIVKPTIDSRSGKNVIKSSLPLKDIDVQYHEDFVIQEIIKQHAVFKSFNESSVNIVRLMTLFIDDKPEVLLACIRVGKVGCVTDVSHEKDGSGTVICGINEDGKLMDFGYNFSGKKVTCFDNGKTCAGSYIPSFEKMKRMALDGHARMPFFKLIGWDITVDENEEPVIVEYNISRPGILYYQWTNGPLFGTNPERIHYIISKLTNTLFV